MKSPNWIGALIAAATLGSAAHGAGLSHTTPVIKVASYYFGQYHRNDPRNAARDQGCVIPEAGDRADSV